MTAKLDRWSQAHITSVCVSLTSRHPDVDHLPLTPDNGRVRTFKCVNVHKFCRWEGIKLACNNVKVVTANNHNTSVHMYIITNVA